MFSFWADIVKKQFKCGRDALFHAPHKMLLLQCAFSRKKGQSPPKIGADIRRKDGGTSGLYSPLNNNPSLSSQTALLRYAKLDSQNTQKMGQ